MKILTALIAAFICSSSFSGDITEHHLSVITPPVVGEYTIILSAHSFPEYWSNNGISKIQSTLYREGTIATNLKVNQKLMVSIDDTSEAGVFTITATNDEIEIQYNNDNPKSIKIQDAIITPDIIINKYTNRGKALEFYILENKKD